ncbi:MAG: flagellar filament capping protein FliD [Myxococcales bacterium]|nr:flagellar filament capping protein FliD [Myxococcales bacterium]
MVSFVGLATGIDSRQLVSDLMTIERAPLKRLQATQAELSSAQTTLAAFMSAVAAIKSAATALSNPNELAGMKATSSGTGVATTVTGTTTAASYDVEVLQLAQAQRTKSSAFASSTAALGKSGTLTFTAGGHGAVDVAIAASDSLADIAARINGAQAHVTASVLYDGSSYRLLVFGADTGASAAIAIGGNETLGLTDGGATYQTAQDARIRLDGQITVSRATNQFDDVLPGLSVTARAVTAAAETLTVAPDPSAIVEKLKSLVEAYNKARAAGHLAAGSGSIKASNPHLAGDGAVRRTLDGLGRAVTSRVSGIGGRYDMLAAIGLHSDRDGNLVLDEDALGAALSANQPAVRTVLAGDASQGIVGAMAKLTKVVEGLAEGPTATLKLRGDSFAKRIAALDKDELVLAARLDAYEKQLQARFAALETLVSQIKAQGDALAGLTSFSFSSSD